MEGYEKKRAPVELGNDENARLHEIRSKATKHAAILSVVMIFCGVASLALGVAILTLGKDGKNPITGGWPITSGFLVLSVGCVALAFGAMEPSPTDDTRKSRKRHLLNGFYYQTFGAQSITGMAIGYAIASAVSCGKDDVSVCGPEVDIQLALNIICAVLGCINFGGLIFVHVIVYKSRKAFGIGGGCCGRKSGCD